MEEKSQPQMAPRDRKELLQNTPVVSSSIAYYSTWILNTSTIVSCLEISKTCFTVSQNPVTNPLQVTYVDIPHSNEPNRIAFIQVSFLFSHLFLPFCTQFEVIQDTSFTDFFHDKYYRFPTKFYFNKSDSTSLAGFCTVGRLTACAFHRIPFR